MCVCRAMRRPRCGLPDRKAEDLDDGARKKRYAVNGQQWDKDHITYRFKALNSDTNPQDEKPLHHLFNAQTAIRFLSV